MQADLVAERRWISDERFREGFAFAQLAPGPLAAQLAMYIGWARDGALGAVVAGTAFVLPPFLMVIAAAAVYRRAENLSAVSSALAGAGAAVIAVILRSGIRLARRSLRQDPLLWVVCIANLALVAFTRQEQLFAVVLSAFAVWLVRGSWLRAFRALSVAPLQLFTIFFKAGAVVFGSGLAIVPFLYGSVVTEHHWLTDRQFLDAVAVGLLSPGPMVITVAFIGYLVAGFAGATLAAIGVFLPVLLLVLLLSPHVSRIAAREGARHAIDGAVAAAIGSLLGAVVILGDASLNGPLAWAIAAGSAILLFAVPRFADVAALGLGAAAAITVHLLGA
jgi:chromate transporter